ncbi:hypothetical protein FQN49_004950 [Arthroderma sp. PD_2]|nr:hypothetical protein FQN49_004950 [Arthroderma sp. PD_2]
MALKRMLSLRIPSHGPFRSPATARKCFRPYIATAQLSSWKGAGTEDQNTNRVKRGDVTDPQTEATKSGQKEKQEGNRVNDKSKSQATTERDQKDSTRKTEEEFPKAPKPVIGMTDERGEVSNNRIPIPVSMFTEGGWLIFAFVSGAEGCVSMGRQEQEEESWRIPPI